MRYIDYYSKSITEESFQLAYETYLEYCSSKQIEPELTQEDFDCTGFADLPESIISHVVYHAEIQGFDIEEELI
jgi:predicted HicB family RNase H-like nuclease